jgi:hypothetical protein
MKAQNPDKPVISGVIISLARLLVAVRLFAHAKGPRKPFDRPARSHYA